MIKQEYQFQIAEDKESNRGGIVYSAFQIAKAAKLYEDWMKNLDIEIHA